MFGLLINREKQKMATQTLYTDPNSDFQYNIREFVSTTYLTFRKWYSDPRGRKRAVQRIKKIMSTKQWDEKTQTVVIELFEFYSEKNSSLEHIMENVHTFLPEQVDSDLLRIPYACKNRQTIAIDPEIY